MTNLPQKDAGAVEASARNHLEQAEAAARRAAGEHAGNRRFENVLIAGGASQSLSLAYALARSGAEVFLLEEDKDDAKRVADFLDRLIASESVDQGQGEGEAAGKIRQRIEIGTQVCDPDRTFDLCIETSSGDLETGTMLRQPESAAEIRIPVLRLAGGGSIARGGRDVAEISLSGPAHSDCLMEIIGGSAADNTAAFALASQLGILAVETQGRQSIADRLSATLYLATDRLLFDGATPWEVDELMEEFGFSAGPCEQQDLAGVDHALALRRVHAGKDILPFIPRMVAEGRLGRKVGVGWYRYPGGGGKVIDPLVEDLIREEAWFAGWQQSPPDHAGIRKRLIDALAAECSRLTANEVTKQSLIDLVSVHAIGFPAALGGLAWYLENGRS